MFEMYKRLAAGEYLGFNNSVFLSEKECADRNFALAYFMRENKCFPPGTKMQETLEFYFQVNNYLEHEGHYVMVNSRRQRI